MLKLNDKLQLKLQEILIYSILEYTAKIPRNSKRFEDYVTAKAVIIGDNYMNPDEYNLTLKIITKYLGL